MNNYKICLSLLIATVFIIVGGIAAGSKASDSSDRPLECRVDEMGNRPVKVGPFRAVRYNLKFTIINHSDRAFHLLASGFEEKYWHVVWDDFKKKNKWDNGWRRKVKIKRNDIRITGSGYEFTVFADDPEPPYDPGAAFIRWKAHYKDQYGKNKTVECIWP